MTNQKVIKKAFNKLRIYYSTISRIDGEFIEQKQEPALFGILTQKKTIMRELTKLHKDKTILLTGQQKIVEEYSIPVDEFLKLSTKETIELEITSI